MKNFFTSQAKIITFILRIILGGVLLSSGVLKAKDSAQSANATAAYKILPTNIAHLFGYALPWLEIAIAFLLILGISVRLAALLAGFIMLVFVAAIASVWARGILIDCGCFGGGGAIDPAKAAQVHRTYFLEILRDLALALSGLYLYFFPHGILSFDKNLATKIEE